MSDKKPTLEDLLRLKRCEHPTDEEWAQFDERLKSKMMCRLREPRKEFSLKFPIKAIVPIGGFGGNSFCSWIPRFRRLEFLYARKYCNSIGSFQDTPSEYRLLLLLQ